ncbi:MAG: hypothetical protein IAE79_16100 [Anaerolinea sp.]|nr:hypothetical protein [Anaerolinea sp.]
MNQAPDLPDIFAICCDCSTSALLSTSLTTLLLVKNWALTFFAFFSAAQVGSLCYAARCRHDFRQTPVKKKKLRSWMMRSQGV